MQSVALRIRPRLIQGVVAVGLLGVLVLLGGAGGIETPAAAAQAAPVADQSLEPPHFHGEPPPFVERELIVIFDDGATLGARPDGTAQIDGGPAAAAIESLYTQFGVVRTEPLVGLATRGREAMPANLLNMALLTLGEGQSVTEAVAAFGASPGVAHAEPNRILTLAETDAPALAPNDPDYAGGYQYGLNGTHGIRAPQAWDTTTGSSNVRIAIIDTGIEQAHFDLSAKYVGGYDYLNNDNTPEDDNGHGTHVAGIAAAMTNNGRGVAGVSWNSPVMAYKVCDSQGFCNSWAILQAVTAAANEPAVRVINLSLGGQYECPASSQAVYDFAYGRGVMVVAAAGNNGVSDPFSPASCSGVIAVGATQSDGRRAYYSNYGSWLDLVAPGSSIKSTYYGNTYAYMSGTSMASPFVAGVAALIYSVMEEDFLPQGATVDQVEEIMTQTASDLGDDFYFGSGLVQADDAVGTARLYRYEPDDSPEQARTIAPNELQSRNIYPISDEDWMSFTLSEESGVIIETMGDDWEDTVMWLYDTDLAMLEYDDDDGDDAYSRIDRECGLDPLPAGHYYIRVRGYVSYETFSYQTLLTRTGACAVPPTINSFSPTAGPPGTAVTINGTNLTGTTAVTFNGLAASFSQVSATRVDAVVPVGATTGPIRLMTSGGKADSATPFSVTAPGDWTPLNLGAAAGTTIESGGQVSLSATGGDIWETADGGHFAHQTATGDRTLVARLTGWNANGLASGKAGLMMRATSDAAAPSYAIHVTGPGRAIKVKYRTSSGYSTVNINGPNTAGLPLWLRLTKSGATVAAAYSTDGLSWTDIGSPQAIDGLDGNYLYGMVAASTSATTPVSATFEPTSFVSPSISDFSPNAGVTGTVITINGANLAGVTEVLLGSTPMTFSAVSDSRVRAVVPAGTPSGRIRLTTAGGTVTSAATFSVLPPGTWVPTNIGEVAGTTISGGDRVTIRATGGDIWGTADNVHFAYQTTSGDRSFIGRVTAWDSGGVQSAKAGLMIRASTDAAAPEFAVHVTGPGRAIKVKYRTSSGWATANVPGVTTTSLPVWLRLTKSGDTVAAAYSADGTNWTTIGTPQRIDGLGGSYLFGMAVVSKSDTAAAEATFAIADVQTPTITGFSPTSGPVGATIAVNGTNLSGLTAVRFNGTAASFVPVSETQVMAIVPPGATTGRISVTTAGGSATSATNFTISNTPPTISGFSPTRGPVGTQVTINGAAFNGAQSVAFNGRAAAFTVTTDGQILAVVPDGATTGKVSVTTAAGTASSAGSFTVTAAAPVVRGFNPGFGPVGTQVTIDGTNLGGVTAVQFNGTPAMFMPISNIQLMAVVPPGATTGTISITTAAGTTTSDDSFSVTGPTVYRMYLPFMRR